MLIDFVLIIDVKDLLTKPDHPSIVLGNRLLIQLYEVSFPRFSLRVVLL